MDIQKFLNYYLKKNQKILLILGPSGVGKSFSAEFLQEYLDYKIAKQLTTREKRPDDKHYSYISADEFVRLQDSGKIIGYFDGDKNSCLGRGYGYLIDDVMEQLERDNKLILFPSAYELESESFSHIYGTTDKIGIGFKNSDSVIKRALQCGKELSEREMYSRVNSAETLTKIMERYSSKDDLFHLIYSDDFGDDLKKSKGLQLSSIVDFIGEDAEDYRGDIDKFISRGL